MDATLAAPLVTPEASKKSSPFGLNVNLDHSVGSGTFINSRYYSYFVGTIMVSPSYTFQLQGRTLVTNARVYTSYEYTRPDNVNGRRVDFPYDPQLNASAPALLDWKATGITVTPVLRVALPLKWESRAAGMIASVGPGVSGSWTYGRVTLSHLIRGTRTFHGRSTIELGEGTTRGEDGFATFLCRGGEATCGSGGANTMWSLSNWTTVDVQAMKKLNVSLGFIVANYWKYSVVSDQDEFTSKVRDSEGNLVAQTGAGRTDLISGLIDVSYQVSGNTKVSLGLTTETSPKTDDNQGFRFPFFDFLGPAANRTEFSLAVDVTI